MIFRAATKRWLAVPHPKCIEIQSHYETLRHSSECDHVRPISGKLLSQGDGQSGDYRIRPSSKVVCYPPNTNDPWMLAGVAVQGSAMARNSTLESYLVDSQIMLALALWKY
jgi:hypothetical protein